MLDGLSTDAHSVGHMIQPRLHPVEDILVPPALEPLELVWGALPPSEQVKQAVRWR